MFDFGKLGGGAAAGFTSGMQQGYNAIDSLVANKQNENLRYQQMDLNNQRMAMNNQTMRLREQQYKAQAFKLMQAMRDDAIRQKALQSLDKATNAGIFSSPEAQALNSKVEQVNSQVKTIAAQRTKDKVSDYLKTEPNNRPTKLNDLTFDTSTMKTLGVKNPSTVGVINLNDPSDVQKVNSYASKYVPKNLLTDEYVKNKVENHEWVKADGKIVDVKGLGIAIGVEPSAFRPTMPNLDLSSSAPNSSAIDAETLEPVDKQQEPEPEPNNQQPQPQPQQQPQQQQQQQQQPQPQQQPQQQQQQQQQPQHRNYDFRGYKTSRGWRNNNPGNMEYGSFAKSHGAIGSDGRFAIFPDVETGLRAMRALLKSSKYRNLTPKQALYRYAPPGENDVQAYADSLRRNGANINKPIKDMNDDEFNRLIATMTDVESVFKRAPDKSVRDFILSGGGSGNYTGTVSHSYQPVNKFNAETINNGSACADGSCGTDLMSQPYQQSLPIDKWGFIAQLAGIQDMRPADVRTMDYIANNMSNPTFGDVLKTFMQMKAPSSSGNGIKKPDSFDSAKQHLLELYTMQYGNPSKWDNNIINNFKKDLNNSWDRLYGGGVGGILQKNATDSLGENYALANKYGNDPVKIADMTDDEILKATKNEYVSHINTTEPYKTNVKSAQGLAQTYELANNILGELNKTPDKYINRGFIDNIMQNALEYGLTPDTIKYANDKTIKGFMSTIGINTKLGMLFNQYLKATSGLQVTDKERQFISNILQASANKNVPALKNALTAFSDVIAMQGNHTVKNLIDMNAVATAAKMAKYFKVPDIAQANAEIDKDVKSKKQPQSHSAKEQIDKHTHKDGNKVNKYGRKIPIDKTRFSDKIKKLPDGTRFKLNNILWEKQGDYMIEVKG